MEIQKKDTREAIVKLEQLMLKHPQADVAVVHRFIDGIYTREVTMAAGLIVIGKVHADEHICIISKGRVRIVDEKTGESLDVIAPFTIMSSPNTKRALHIIEETVWTTIHANPDNTKDIEKLEARLIAPDKKLETEVKKCLG